MGNTGASLHPEKVGMIAGEKIPVMPEIVRMIPATNLPVFLVIASVSIRVL